ncbi:hypothetical protein N9V56_00805 [Alphaproteobacteria bacterium]|nr:hypothetical protein [Alphaproteobacteria bacterium]
MKKVILIIFAIIFLTNCASENRNKTAYTLGLGTLAGITTYALTKDEGATMGSFAVFSAIGNSIGTKFDEVNALKQELLNTKNDNEKVKWEKVTEEGENLSFEMSADNTTKNYKNETCREYKYQFQRNDESYFGSGTACLDANGNWVELYHN